MFRPERFIPALAANALLIGGLCLPAVETGDGNTIEFYTHDDAYELPLEVTPVSILNNTVTIERTADVVGGAGNITH